MASAPDKAPALGDPGDDTALRYRYQWTYAAIVCCMLLDETQNVVEIFCEHHEDVLVKHDDGSFSGLQIKTRATDQAPWKVSDESVRNSCVRFARLESQFPGSFRKFHFLTNHPLHAAQNGQDVRHVLAEIRSAASPGDVSTSASKFLARIAREARGSVDTAFAALAKAHADDGLPKLEDIEVRLVATLTGVWLQAADCSYGSAVRAARSLVSECGRASSLAHNGVLPAYLPVTPDPQGTELTSRLAEKRINKSRVLGVLDRGINEAAPLAGDPENSVEPGSGATDILLRKLDAGGFSAVSRNSALDLRDKADYLGIVWTQKYGRAKGLQRYGHVRSLVLSDAARAFEATKGEGDPFGLHMLTELRSRFRERRAEGDQGSQLYDCSNEHLEGFTYSLTSECKVQWSLARPWEDE